MVVGNNVSAIVLVATNNDIAGIVDVWQLAGRHGLRGGGLLGSGSPWLAELGRGCVCGWLGSRVDRIGVRMSGGAAVVAYVCCGRLVDPSTEVTWPRAVVCV